MLRFRFSDEFDVCFDFIEFQRSLFRKEVINKFQNIDRISMNMNILNVINCTLYFRLQRQICNEIY